MNSTQFAEQVEFEDDIVESKFTQLYGEQGAMAYRIIMDLIIAEISNTTSTAADDMLADEYEQVIEDCMNGLISLYEVLNIIEPLKDVITVVNRLANKYGYLNIQQVAKELKIIIVQLIQAVADSNEA